MVFNPTGGSITNNTLNALNQGASLVRTGSGNIVRTSSGGVVRTRTATEIREAQASSQNFSSGFSKKRNKKSRIRAPAVIDARPKKKNQSSQQGTAEGDNILVIQEIGSRDQDDKSRSATEYLSRLNKQRSNLARSTSVKAPVSPMSFQQSVQSQLSSGAMRLDDPSLSGTGFGASSRGGGSAGGASSVARTSAVLGLPTPDNLQEAMRLSYENKNSSMSAMLQEAVGKAVNAGFAALQPGMNDTQRTEAFRNIGTSISEKLEGIRQTYSKPGALQNVVEALLNQSGMGTGARVAFNNTMVQQFSGVAPRSFTFTWKLYAEDPGQSANIYNIIQILKEASHPELIDPIFNIIRYPAILKKFEIRSPSGFIIFPIFPSVITDLVVDYSASGAPYFFKNGMPASIALTMSITEVTSRTRNDFRGDSGSGGGGEVNGGRLGGFASGQPGGGTGQVA